MKQQIMIRLNELLQESSDLNYQLGLNWYFRANKIAQEIADDMNLPLFKVVGVMAALSPNNKWDSNLRDTRKFLLSPSLSTKVSTYTMNRRKALRILEAQNSSEVLTILRGPKITAFYNNILKPKFSEDVTVDLWMFRAAKLDNTKRNHEIISQAVLTLAKNNGMMPHQLQAILWGTIRGRIL